MDEPIVCPKRSQARQFVAVMLIGTATAQALGMSLRMPTQLEANDISRWCTVWSLLERGTYAIDDCPWQANTQDKVFRPEPFPPAGRHPVQHFYSSKPPLLPTLIAGLLYPFRAVVGVPLDAVVEQARVERWVQKEKPGIPGQFEAVRETPAPVRWSAYVFYLKPIVVLLNVVPLCILLFFYARLLDRYAAGDWSWFLSLFAAAWCTHLFAFEQTLNNHTIAAWSAFFAIYALLKIWNEPNRSPALFAAAGFFAAFCACNELPAALFGLALFALLLYRAPRPSLLYFAPAAALPCAAFLITQFLAMGTWKPVYGEFGTQSYEYAGSYWTTPLEFDYFNKHPEPTWLYFFHMMVGHHGVFSLTPIFLFSVYSVVEHLRGRMRKMTPLAWLTALLTVAVLAFYAGNPQARNYGGSTSGLRWLFWLYPFWLALLPTGLEPGEHPGWFRRLSLAALVISAFSIGYAMRSPWSHPWLLDWLEHLNLYTLVR
jgi:hypothetical protein